MLYSFVLVMTLLWRTGLYASSRKVNVSVLIAQRLTSVFMNSWWRMGAMDMKLTCHTCGLTNQ